MLVPEDVSPGAASAIIVLARYKHTDKCTLASSLAPKQSDLNIDHDSLDLTTAHLHLGPLAIIAAFNLFGLHFDFEFSSDHEKRC